MSRPLHLTDFIDDPDESVSNVSGDANTKIVGLSRRQAVFAAKQKIQRQQQLQLERSLVEIENEEILADIEQQRRELEQDRLTKNIS